MSSYVWQSLGVTLIYFFVGLVVLFVGRKVLDWITPYKLDQQISEEGNLAVGIIEGGFYVALAIITHASITGGVASESLWMEIWISVVYFVLSLIILAIGFLVFDLITPFSMKQEIVEGKNVAAGATESAFLIALGIIIHGAI